MKSQEMHSVVTRQHIIIKPAKLVLRKRLKKSAEKILMQLKKIKQLKYAIIIASISMVSLESKAQAFVSGTNTLSASIGIGGRLGSYVSSSQSPGLSANFERGIWEIGSAGVISLGGYAGLKSYKYEKSYNSSYWNGNRISAYTYKTTSKWKYTIIGMRSAFHYNAIGGDKLDLYGGLLLSYNILSYKFTDNDPYYDYGSSVNYGSAVGLTAYIGARYLLANNFGVYSELGYGISYLTIGASLKF